MKAHGFAYGFIAVLLFSTYHPSSGDIGNFFPEDSTVNDLFSSGQDANHWRRFQAMEGSKRTYYFRACKSQNWLRSTETLNTSGIKELTVRVVYKHYIASSKVDLFNKTKFSLGQFIITNRKIVRFHASGILNNITKRLISTTLLPGNYPEMKILIGPPDKKDCMIVYDVRVTYNFCRKEVFLGVAHFPHTYAPRNGSKALQVEGRCSYGTKTPVAYCDSKGKWWFNETLPCNCAPGELKNGMECIEIPSIIQEVKAVRLSNNRALLSWKQKVLPNVQYTVICKKCNGQKCDQNCSSAVHLIESKSSIAGRNSSNIIGLERQHDYMFIVVGRIDADNNKHRNETSKQVKLRALPEEVRNVTVASHNENSVVLTWLPPRNINTTNISYEVACRAHCLDPSCTSDCGTLKFVPSRFKLLRTNVTITGFRNDGLLYVFEILSKHRSYDSSEEFPRINWNFVAINYTDYKEIIPKVSKSFNVVDVIIGVSVLISAVILITIGTRCYHKWKRRKHTLTFDDENPEHLTLEVPLTEITQHYVDPSNYDSVENVLRKFTTKLNERNLKTEAIIGEGEFGVVWKGYLEVEGKDPITVAVKSLRSGLSAKLRRDFLAEASVMGQFKDPNVISLHGVVVKRHTVKIVMEFMSNGSLDQYLVKYNARLTTLQLLGMARGIASGMNYLSGRNFIHRDLAARNILVDENNSCKVSDFGLTREICQTSNYETRGGKIPIRWTAPEVIKHRKSFIASDVWSYGVVLWEIMSFGQRPYWEWDNFQVLQEIETGYRLPAPLKCPKTVHSLMLHCWEKERSNRPTFVRILQKIDEWIRSPETIHHSPATKAKRSTMELIENPSPIYQWLESIKMGKYAPKFTEAGYNRVSQVVALTEQDLTDMGITLVGHRHKIHQSIPLVT